MPSTKRLVIDRPPSGILSVIEIGIAPIRLTGRVVGGSHECEYSTMFETPQEWLYHCATQDQKAANRATSFVPRVHESPTNVAPPTMTRRL